MRTQRFKVNKMNIKIKGFSVVELLIVITIIGILTAIVIPLYFQYLQKSTINACLYEVKGYANQSIYRLSDEDSQTLPFAPTLSACSFITDASQWDETKINQVIEAKSKNSPTIDIRCNLRKGANCIKI